MSLRRRLLAAIAAAAAVAAGIVVPAAPAAAHPSGWYYTQGKWPTDATISFGVNAGWPGGDYTYRMLNGRDHWNAMDTGPEPQTYWSLADYVNYGTFGNPCGLSTPGNNTGVLFWMDLDYLGGSVAGATLACRNGANQWTKAALAIDSDQWWYTGTGATPGGQMDLWSVATHEFGHWMGFWVHLAEAEGGVCPAYENQVRHAMCPAIWPGYWVQRHTKTHDTHTHTAAYP